MSVFLSSRMTFRHKLQTPIPMSDRFHGGQLHHGSFFFVISNDGSDIGDLHVIILGTRKYPIAKVARRRKNLNQIIPIRTDIDFIVRIAISTPPFNPVEIIIE